MPQNRILPTLLALSASGLVGIAVYEGYRPKAYDDGVGVQTVGFGSTTHSNGARCAAVTPPRQSARWCAWRRTPPKKSAPCAPA